MLCHHLLTEAGKFVHNHPHCSFKLFQINTIIDLKSSQATPCPWTELQQTPETRTFFSSLVVCLANHCPQHFTALRFYEDKTNLIYWQRKEDLSWRISFLGTSQDGVVAPWSHLTTVACGTGRYSEFKSSCVSPQKVKGKSMLKHDLLNGNQQNKTPQAAAFPKCLFNRQLELIKL